MRNKVSIARLILVLSIVIPSSFFVSMLVFFTLNVKAYAQVALLNLLQFNVKGVEYAFIPGIFGYALVGATIILLWVSVWHTVPKVKAAALVFALSGILLVVIGVKPNLQGQVTSLYYLSILYIVLNLIGLVILLAKSAVLWNKWVLSLFLTFVVYELVDRFILFENNFNLNVLISMCFIWYLYLFKYLNSEFNLNPSRQPTLS